MTGSRRYGGETLDHILDIASRMEGRPWRIGAVRKYGIFSSLPDPDETAIATVRHQEVGLNPASEQDRINAEGIVVAVNAMADLARRVRDCDVNAAFNAELCDALEIYGNEVGTADILARVHELVTAVHTMRQAILKHRRDIWGDGPISHGGDMELYETVISDGLVYQEQGEE